ncbi:MAG: class I SAM-dependent methyltransferase [Chloroflexota bacterium]
MAPSARAFVVRHTTLKPVPGVPGIRLHQADEVLALWHAVQLETADPDAALPYWAFAWAGGLALARYLHDEPARVAGRRVFDVGSGSGLCAIVAARLGATAVTATDVDPFAAAAIPLNARANGCRVTVVHRDVLDEPAPDADLVLAADCWYDGRLAERAMPWLRRARDGGAEVLLGDPGRRYLPTDGLLKLGSYEVRTTTELEDLEQKWSGVYALASADLSTPPVKGA